MAQRHGCAVGKAGDLAGLGIHNRCQRHDLEGEPAAHVDSGAACTQQDLFRLRRIGGGLCSVGVFKDGRIIVVVGVGHLRMDITLAVVGQCYRYVKYLGIIFHTGSTALGLMDAVDQNPGAVGCGVVTQCGAGIDTGKGDCACRTGGCCGIVGRGYEAGLCKTHAVAFQMQVEGKFAGGHIPSGKHLVDHDGGLSAFLWRTERVILVCGNFHFLLHHFTVGLDEVVILGRAHRYLTGSGIQAHRHLHIVVSGVIGHSGVSRCTGLHLIDSEVQVTVAVAFGVCGLIHGIGHVDRLEGDGRGGGCSCRRVAAEGDVCNLHVAVLIHLIHTEGELTCLQGTVGIFVRVGQRLGAGQGHLCGIGCIDVGEAQAVAAALGNGCAVNLGDIRLELAAIVLNRHFDLIYLVGVGDLAVGAGNLGNQIGMGSYGGVSNGVELQLAVGQVPAGGHSITGGLILHGEGELALGLARAVGDGLAACQGQLGLTGNIAVGKGCAGSRCSKCAGAVLLVQCPGCLQLAGAVIGNGNRQQVLGPVEDNAGQGIVYSLLHQIVVSAHIGKASGGEGEGSGLAVAADRGLCGNRYCTVSHNAVGIAGLRGEGKGSRCKGHIGAQGLCAGELEGSCSRTVGVGHLHVDNSALRNRHMVACTVSGRISGLGCLGNDHSRAGRQIMDADLLAVLDGDILGDTCGKGDLIIVYQRSVHTVGIIAVQIGAGLFQHQCELRASQRFNRNIHTGSHQDLLAQFQFSGEQVGGGLVGHPWIVAADLDGSAVFNGSLGTGIYLCAECNHAA